MSINWQMATAPLKEMETHRHQPWYTQGRIGPSTAMPKQRERDKERALYPKVLVSLNNGDQRGKRWGFSPTTLASASNSLSVPWRIVSSHLAPLCILWILRESSQLLKVLWDTGVCCLDCGSGIRGGNFQNQINDSA